jgi:hypothetical protein
MIYETDNNLVVMIDGAPTFTASPGMAFDQKQCKPDYEGALNNVRERIKAQSAFLASLEDMVLRHEPPNGPGMDALLGRVRLQVLGLERQESEIMETMERNA